MEVKKEFEQLSKDNVKYDIKGNHDHDVDLSMPKNELSWCVKGFVDRIVQTHKNRPSDDDILNYERKIAKEQIELEEAGRRHRENRNNIHVTSKFPAGTKFELVPSEDEARKVENRADLHVQDDEFTMDF